MKIRINITQNAIIGVAALVFYAAASAWAGQGNQGNPGVLPPGSSAYGKTYAEWSVAWMQWFMGLPLLSPDGVTHPVLDDPRFDVTEGQTGHVWFLAAPSPGAFVRTCTIPSGTALFFLSLGAEWSSLEGFPTEAEQRAAAILSGNHIVNPFFIVDGVLIENVGAYRFTSPQFTFTAPTPWVFGDTGGTGTTVADGYYLFLAPLAVGQHTLRYGGAIHFSIAEGDDFDFDLPLDMTYHITVR